MANSGRSPILSAVDGVTTRFLWISEPDVRSMVDRLGKAARKASQDEGPAAWLMVGRVQSELSALIRKSDT